MEPEPCSVVAKLSSPGSAPDWPDWPDCGPELLRLQGGLDTPAWSPAGGGETGMGAARARMAAKGLVAAAPRLASTVRTGTLSWGPPAAMPQVPPASGADCVGPWANMLLPDAGGPMLLRCDAGGLAPTLPLFLGPPAKGLAAAVLAKLTPFAPPANGLGAMAGAGGPPAKGLAAAAAGGPPAKGLDSRPGAPPLPAPKLLPLPPGCHVLAGWQMLRMVPARGATPLAAPPASAAELLQVAADAPVPPEGGALLPPSPSMPPAMTTVSKGGFCAASLPLAPLLPSTARRRCRTNSQAAAAAAATAAAAPTAIPAIAPAEMLLPPSLLLLLSVLSVLPVPPLLPPLLMATPSLRYSALEGLIPIAA